MSSFAPTLEAFFTERLARQRQASPKTVAAYRDGLRQLLAFVQRQLGKAPSTLDVADVDAPMIGAFLEYVEHERHNTRTPIPAIPEYMATVAGYGISMWVAVQSLAQLETHYGAARAATIRDGADAHVYYRQRDVETAEALSRRTGPMLVQGRHNGASQGATASWSEATPNASSRCCCRTRSSSSTRSTSSPSPAVYRPRVSSASTGG